MWCRNGVAFYDKLAVNIITSARDIFHRDSYHNVMLLNCLYWIVPFRNICNNILTAHPHRKARDIFHQSFYHNARPLNY